MKRFVRYSRLLLVVAVAAAFGPGFDAAARQNGALDRSASTVLFNIGFLPGSFDIVRVYGDYVFASSSTYNDKNCTGQNVYPSLCIIDVSDRRHPTLVKDIDQPGAISDLEIVGKYLYVFTSAGLTIYDITTPTAPVAVQGFDGTPYQYGFARRDDLIFLPTSTGTRVLDVTNPAAPVPVADYPTIKIETVAGNRAYEQLPSPSTILTSTLNTYDITNILSPTLVGTFVRLGEGSILANDHYLYVSAFSPPHFHWIQVYDMTDPNMPILGPAFSYPTTAPQMHLIGNRLYTATSLGAYYQYGGFEIFDVSQPGSPALLNSFTIDTNDVTADNTYVYVSHMARGWISPYADGLYIFTEVTVTPRVYLPLVARE